MFRILCSGDKCYIDQTKQYLQCRLNQQKNDCKNQIIDTKVKTALAFHHYETGHNLNFNNIEF